MTSRVVGRLLLAQHEGIGLVLGGDWTGCDCYLECFYSLHPLVREKLLESRVELRLGDIVLKSNVWSNQPGSCTYTEPAFRTVSIVL